MKSKIYTRLLFAGRLAGNSKAVLAVLLLTLLSFQLQSQNWYQVASGTQNKLNTICFSSPNVGYIGGNDSLLMKTIDGGLTWSMVNFTGVTFYPGGEDILNLQFLNDSTGFMTVGPYSGSYGTTDGGLTWTVISLAGNQCFNKGMYFFDQSNGFIGGSGCFQGELISYVANTLWSAGPWTASTMNGSSFNANDMITDIVFYNPNYGLAASKSGYIFRTIDGGINWDSVSSPIPQNPITSVLIVNDTLAYAGYESLNTGFGLYISTDAGLTWNYDNNSATFLYPDFMTLHQSGNGTIYSGGVSQGLYGVIFHSPGSFQLWDYDAVDQKINDVSSYNDSIVYAVGDSGYIVVNMPFINTGIENTISNQQSFSVYPNPTSGSFTIFVENKDERTRNQDLVIEMYDVLGNKVLQSLINNLKSEINISQFKSGMYFARVIDSNANTVYSQRVVKE